MQPESIEGLRPRRIRMIFVGVGWSHRNSAIPIATATASKLAVCHSRALGPVVHYTCLAYVHTDAGCGESVGDNLPDGECRSPLAGHPASVSSKCRCRYERTGKCRIVHLSRMHLPGNIILDGAATWHAVCIIGKFVDKSRFWNLIMSDENQQDTQAPRNVHHSQSTYP